MYTGRGPVCGMIIRGGGASGVEGFTGAAACICITLLGAGGSAIGGAPPAGAAGVTRGGTAIADEDAVGVEVDPAVGVGAAGGTAGTLGGMTTTDGGRYVAATDAGVTIRGAGGAGAGASAAGLAGIFGATGATGVSAFASTAGVTGGRTAGRAAGCSATLFCWVIARSTSPGREICERSILVLISSSPCMARDEVLAALGAASERPRRCFRTRSASWSSSELECVFFSVTPTVVSTSRISLLLTSSSRARSLIRILLIRSRSSFVPLIARL